MSSLPHLPSELLLLIFRRLSPNDRYSISRVCTRFSQLIDYDGFITEDCYFIGLHLDTERFMFSLRDESSVVLSADGRFYTFHDNVFVIYNGENRWNRDWDSEKRKRRFDGVVITGNTIRVRDAGDLWSTMVERYLFKLKYTFAEKSLRYLTVALTSKPPLPITNMLRTLQDFEIEHMRIQDQDFDDECISFPTDLLPLTLMCTSSLFVFHPFNIDWLPHLNADSIICITYEDAVRFLQLHANGILPKLQHKIELFLRTNIDQFLLDAYPYGVVDVRDVNPFEYPLNKRPQNTGDIYDIWICKEGGIDFRGTIPEDE